MRADLADFICGFTHIFIFIGNCFAFNNQLFALFRPVFGRQMKLCESYLRGRNPIQKGIQMDEITNQKKTIYYTLLAISISVLSLIFSIVSLIKKNDIGRYRAFVEEGSTFVYVFDTKTSHLFLRGFVKEKYVCLDLGTVDQPHITFSSNEIVVQQRAHGFIPDQSIDFGSK